MQKSSTTHLRSDFKCGSDQRWWKCGARVECKCMEYVAIGWCKRLWLKLYETIKNLTFDDIGIPLVVIQMGVLDWKASGLCISLTFLRGEGAVRFCGLEIFWVIGIMVVMLMSYSRAVKVVLVLLEIGLVLRKRYRTEWQKVCCIDSGSRYVALTLQEFNIRYTLMWDM